MTHLPICVVGVRLLLHFAFVRAETVSAVQRLLGGARDDLAQIEVRLLQIEISELGVRLQFELARQGGESEDRGRAVVGGVEKGLATVGGIRW